LSAQSLPPVATLLPSAAQSTANTCTEVTQNKNSQIAGNKEKTGYTSSAWPGRSIANFLVFASQTFTVLSLEADTSRRLSLDHAT
jgi:hypothetical protein